MFWCFSKLEIYFNSRPHGGRPGHRNCKNRVAGHFNSRPHGGRQKQQYFNEYGKRFQLTPSRRATALVREFSIVHDISTHALTEGDLLQSMVRLTYCTFQLTPSRRATTLCQAFRQSPVFQLTPSRRATADAGTDIVFYEYFNSRPHGGRRQI